MRETFIQCDHCGERVRDNTLPATQFRECYAHVVHGTPSQEKCDGKGDLCTPCYDELRGLIREFFAGPRRD
jgi:hypothetical protein